MRKIKTTQHLNSIKDNAKPKEKHPKKRVVLRIAKQYQGLSLSRLVEVGKRGLKKAAIRTQELRSEQKKLSQRVWFIRQEIVNEVATTG